MLNKEKIKAENKAYDELVKKGYRPQGYSFDKKKVVVIKIENEHKNNEKMNIYYFDNWQDANKALSYD